MLKKGCPSNRTKSVRLTQAKVRDGPTRVKSQDGPVQAEGTTLPEGRGGHPELKVVTS